MTARGTVAGADRLQSKPNPEDAMGLFTKDIKTLNDLFVHTLQDIYYAEQQIAKNLPDMVSKATDATLKNGFEKHLEETKGQIERLESFRICLNRGIPKSAAF